MQSLVQITYDIWLVRLPKAKVCASITSQVRRRLNICNLAVNGLSSGQAPMMQIVLIETWFPIHSNRNGIHVDSTCLFNIQVIAHENCVCLPVDMTVKNLTSNWSFTGRRAISYFVLILLGVKQHQ
jgi:hypothetical protein